MNEPVVPISRLATVAAWTATALLIMNAWLAYALGASDLSDLLGFSGCAMSAVAATCSIRCFASKLSRLVRLATGMPPLESPRSLHSVAD